MSLHKGLQLIIGCDVIQLLALHQPSQDHRCLVVLRSPSLYRIRRPSVHLWCNLPHGHRALHQCRLAPMFVPLFVCLYLCRANSSFRERVPLFLWVSLYPQNLAYCASPCCRHVQCQESTVERAGTASEQAQSAALHNVREPSLDGRNAPLYGVGIAQNLHPPSPHDATPGQVVASCDRNVAGLRSTHLSLGGGSTEDGSGSDPIVGRGDSYRRLVAMGGAAAAHLAPHFCHGAPEQGAHQQHLAQRPR